MIPRPETPIALALDVSDLEVAERLARDLAGEVGLLKVGLELSWAHGPEAVRRIANGVPRLPDWFLKGLPIFVDPDGLRDAGKTLESPVKAPPK